MTAKQFIYVFFLGSLTAQGITPERASILAQQYAEERCEK